MEATNTQDQAHAVKYDVTEAKLGKIRQKFEKLPDAMEKEGYAVLAAGLKEVKGYLANTEKLRVAQNEGALKWQRAVNAKAKSIKEALVPIRDKIEAAKKVKDDDVAREKEEKRVAAAQHREKIMARIEEIRNIAVSTIGKSADEIEAVAHELYQRDLIGFEDFTSQAKKVKLEIVNALWELHDQAIAAQEAEKRRVEKVKEQKEADRIAAHKYRIAQIEALPTGAIGKTSGEIQQYFFDVEQIPTIGYEEFQPNAVEAKKEALSKLRNLRDQAVASEKAEADRIEEARRAHIQTEIRKIKDAVALAVGDNAANIADAMDHLRGADLSRFEEFQDEAKEAQLETLSKLSELHDQAAVKEKAEADKPGSKEPEPANPAPPAPLRGTIPGPGVTKPANCETEPGRVVPVKPTHADQVREWLFNWASAIPDDAFAALNDTIEGWE